MGLCRIALVACEMVRLVSRGRRASRQARQRAAFECWNVCIASGAQVLPRSGARRSRRGAPMLRRGHAHGDSTGPHGESYRRPDGGLSRSAGNGRVVPYGFSSLNRSQTHWLVARGASPVSTISTEQSLCNRKSPGQISPNKSVRLPLPQVADQQISRKPAPRTCSLHSSRDIGVPLAAHRASTIRTGSGSSRTVSPRTAASALSRGL